MHLQLLLGKHATGDETGVQGHCRKTPAGGPGASNIGHRRRKDPTPGTIWVQRDVCQAPERPAMVH
jgi:hypothetical protein